MGWVPRVALAAAVVAVAIAGAVMVPELRAESERREAAEQREGAAAKERRARVIEADQRPRRGRAVASPATAAPAVQLAARARALTDLRAAIRTDARRRVRAGSLAGPIGGVECERYPPADDVLAPERELGSASGRYACLAVTRTFEGGVLGHPYRALIDFETGRYAYCKITGSPELVRDPRLATPRACAG